MESMVHKPELSRLHYELIGGLIQRSVCPALAELAARMSLSEQQVRDLLHELAGIHGVVLHPHVCEPWIIHPFSLTPTLNWITGPTGCWWAPCIWCALGVAVLAGGDTRIHTRFGAEGEPLVIDVTDGEPKVQDVWVIRPHRFRSGAIAIA